MVVVFSYEETSFLHVHVFQDLGFSRAPKKKPQNGYLWLFYRILNYELIKYDSLLHTDNRRHASARNVAKVKKYDCVFAYS